MFKFIDFYRPLGSIEKSGRESRPPTTAISVLNGGIFYGKFFSFTNYNKQYFDNKNHIFFYCSKILLKKAIILNIQTKKTDITDRVAVLLLM